MAAFAKYDGVDGESDDANHGKWIDVLSIDWGAHKPGGGATGQSRRRGAAVVEDLTLTFEYEKAAPKLQEKCLKGEVIPKLEIELHGHLRRGAGDLPEVCAEERDGHLVSDQCLGQRRGRAADGRHRQQLRGSQGDLHRVRPGGVEQGQRRDRVQGREGRVTTGLPALHS